MIEQFCFYSDERKPPPIIIVPDMFSVVVVALSHHQHSEIQAFIPLERGNEFLSPPKR